MEGRGVPGETLRIPFGKIGVHRTGKIRGITTRDPGQNPISSPLNPGWDAKPQSSTPESFDILRIANINLNLFVKTMWLGG